MDWKCRKPQKMMNRSRNQLRLSLPRVVLLVQICFMLKHGSYAFSVIQSNPLLLRNSKGVVTASSITTTSLWGLRGKKIRRLKRQALQEPTPPEIKTVYGPIRIPKASRFCETCNGRGMIRCPICEGRGAVRQTGSTKKNILPPNLLQSQWTSVEIRNGHRQHTIVETRGSKKKKNLECRIINICGNVKDTWIPANELRDKTIWRKGWTTLEEIQRADRGALKDARPCFRCKGKKVLSCVECDAKGEIPSYEPLHN